MLIVVYGANPEKSAKSAIPFVSIPVNSWLIPSLCQKIHLTPNSLYGIINI